MDFDLVLTVLHIVYSLLRRFRTETFSHVYFRFLRCLFFQSCFTSFAVQLWWQVKFYLSVKQFSTYKSNKYNSIAIEINLLFMEVWWALLYKHSMFFTVHCQYNVLQVGARGFCLVVFLSCRNRALFRKWWLYSICLTMIHVIDKQFCDFAKKMWEIISQIRVNK